MRLTDGERSVEDGDNALTPLDYRVCRCIMSRLLFRELD